MKIPGRDYSFHLSLQISFLQDLFQALPVHKIEVIGIQKSIANHQKRGQSQELPVMLRPVGRADQASKSSSLKRLVVSVIQISTAVISPIQNLLTDHSCAIQVACSLV